MRDDDPSGAVRIVTPGYAGGRLHVTVRLHLDGILETGYWTPVGDAEHPLPRFVGALEGGYWVPNGDDGYRPDFTRQNRGDELIEQPVLCRSCGCATGPPGLWVIEDYCDRCTNYGGF